MTPRWRVRDLAGEAVRAIGAAPVGALLLVLVVAGTVAAGTLLDATEARRGRVQLAAQITDGRWVTVARASQGIDARTCSRLAQQPEVLAAGGVEKPVSVALSSAPGTLFEAYGTTPEFIDVLTARGAPAASAGVVAVGAALARELGLVDGSTIVVAPGAHHRVRVLAESVRAGRFSRALLVPSALARVDECWVEWLPGLADVRPLTEALLAVGSPLNVSTTLTAGAYTEDPFTRYAQRWTRWWSLPVGLLGALVVAGSLRARARSLALYVAVGTGRAELVALVALEILAVALLGTLAGLTWALAHVALGGPMTTSDLRAAVGAALFVPACMTAATVLLVGARRSDVAAELKAD